MNKYVAIDNLTEVLNGKQLSGITLWNRLEARPRTDNFDRSLKAELRDALWMLGKQWQMGEFLGDDAGSPVDAHMYLTNTRLTKYAPGEQEVQAFSETTPLEAQVEKRNIPFSVGASPVSLDLRLLMGRHWLKMIAAYGTAVLNDFRNKYPVSLPDPQAVSDAYITAHKEAWQQFQLVAGRSMDGAMFYQYLKLPGNKAHDAIASLTSAQYADIDKLGERFISWFEKLYYQPDVADNAGDKDAWNPQKLEYRFACSAPTGDTEKLFVADEYYHGHLDWYNLDIDKGRTSLGDTGLPADPETETPVKRNFIPVPVQYDGMPNTRWWTFEDGQTNFGNINPTTRDIGKLLFMEFSLVYANDWFIVPVTLPAGSVAEVKGLSVTNVFGERLWVEAAGKGLDDAWNKWSMFTLNTAGKSRDLTDTSLLVLPTVTKIQEGKPLEEIHFIRDEMANMVWGIETTVPLASGGGKQGNEAATELRGRLQQIMDKDIADGTITPVEKQYKADLRYEVMNIVPENWIPFIPARVENSNRSIRLQRAAMPRILNGIIQKVEPRTSLLREGLDKAETYFIHEEEISRAGTQLSESFQRARWYNGKVITWLGIRKQTGRGEGASNLAFDQARNVEKPAESITG